MDVKAFLPEGTEVATGSEPDEVGGSETRPVVAEVTEVSVNEAAPAERPPVDLAVLTRIESDLAAVDSALAALDDGSYGTCTACGTEIEPEVMALDPVRLTCAPHSAP